MLLIASRDIRLGLLRYRSGVTATASLAISSQSLAGSTGLWFIAETALFV